MTVVAVNAPKNEPSDSESDAFYQLIIDVGNKMYRQDILKICGKDNAKVRFDASYAPSVLGAHQLNEPKGNSISLADLYVIHNMAVGGAWFPHSY
ncbi:hypothetical protein QYM36_009234 [Artemia franciscana]|uniref:Uncharacterized protein n=1 Tax=Artemia franciscana TaxID=6661 RepID=A0AA88I0W6_ARTSF|nr:hypothetical protein QYM36_009234 [Artemia franciscana]